MPGTVLLKDEELACDLMHGHHGWQ